MVRYYVFCEVEIQILRKDEPTYNCLRYMQAGLR